MGKEKEKENERGRGQLGIRKKEKKPCDKSTPTFFVPDRRPICTISLLTSFSLSAAMAMRPLLLQLLLLSGLSVVSIASLSFRRPMRDPSNSRASVPYRSSSFSSCRHVPGLDFGDAGWSAQGSTPDDCCQRCIATTGCAAVVYAQGVCYFKNSTFAPKQGEAGAIACTPEAALPPASQLRSRLGATHWNGCYNRR